ncbi:MAG TPA: hypothetical protein VI757_12800 [Bacteroidia bacterium]|nr:hypothetical protein [Bacteroidia bacterium]
MKILFTLIILLSASAVFLVRSYKTPPVAEVVVLRDITDSLLAQPQADNILSLYDFDKSKWNGTGFRFVDLSDVSFNHASEAKIETANQWLSNEPEREKEIKNFKSKVAEILSQKKAVGKSHSSVYLPLARELNRLSRNRANRKILLVYSDLMENSPDISFYDIKTFHLFQSNPDSLKNLFEKIQSLNSLNGIEMYFVFQPKDVIQDSEFKIVSEFYRKMLEEKGAQVTIAANL